MDYEAGDFDCGWDFGDVDSDDTDGESPSGGIGRRAGFRFQ